MAAANTTPALSDARLWDIAQRIGRMANLLKAGFDIDESKLDLANQPYLHYARALVKGMDYGPLASNVIDARRRFVRKSEAVVSGA